MQILYRPRRQTYTSPERVRAKNALTASGQRVTRKDGDNVRRLIQPWQARAFGFYDELGEIKYAAQFYSRALSKLRLYAAEIDEDGEIVETEDATAKAELARIQDPGGGRSTLLASYGRLMFLAGECLLFVSRDPETKIEQWEFLSTDELRIMGSSYTRYRAPQLGADEYTPPVDDADFEPVGDKEAVAYRIWRRHPRYSSLADSTMQGVLTICEELVLLTRVIRARAVSRTAGAGLLLLPDTVSPAPPQAGKDEDMLEDPFMADLIEAMTTPIMDEGSASAVVPMVLRGDKEALDAVRHLQLVDPLQLYPETGLRMELIKRLAIGLDMPAEVLTGMADVNHWGSWQVDEQTWKAHLQPVAQYLVDDLTSAFYRPQLRQLKVANWERHIIGYDAAEVINHPDRTKDAKDLHDRAVIGDEALREAGGFDDEDAATPEEINRRIGILTHDSSLATYGIPSVRSTIEPLPGEVVSTTGKGGADTGNEVVKSPPANGNAPMPEDVLGSLEVARIMGACDLALRRAREKAGSRLMSLAKRDPETAKTLRGTAPSMVAPTLGYEQAMTLRAPEARELVGGAAEILIECLRIYGIEDEKVAGFLCDQIERHAARTLYEPNPAALPSSLAHYLTEIAKP